MFNLLTLALLATCIFKTHNQKLINYLKKKKECIFSIVEVFPISEPKTKLSEIKTNLNINNLLRELSEMSQD